MEDKTKKILGWVLAIIAGLVVYFLVSGVFNDIASCSEFNAFTIVKEEQTYTYEKYYTGNRILPDICPAVKLTVKNTSNKALHVYGEVNFYKDGALYETAYISTDTLAPDDETEVTVSASNGVVWNTYDSYTWTYKIVSIKCNYS